MTDHFAVLRQPRRPWLDPHQLKRQYQELTFDLHPDRRGGAADEIDFSSINEAYRILSNPKLRLQHLLSFENASNADRVDVSEAPAELTDMFMKTAALLQEIDGFLQNREQASSQLRKSLLQREAAGMQQRLNLLLEQLQRLQETAEEDLRRADEIWVRNRPNAAPLLSSLVHCFGHLDRWMSQLRERQFQLSS